MHFLIQNIEVPLKKGDSFPLDVETGVLSLGAILPSFSISLSLPVNDITRKLFGYPEDLLSTTEASKIIEDVVLMDGNTPRQRGVIELLNIGDYEYGITFRSGSGELTSLVKDKPLKEEFAGVTMSIGGTAQHIHVVKFTTDPVNSYKIVISSVTYEQFYSGNAATDLAGLATKVEANSAVDSVEVDAANMTIKIKSQMGGADPSPLAYTNASATDTPVPIVLDQLLEIAFPDLGEKYFLPTMEMPSLYDDQCENFSGYANLYEHGTDNYDYIGGSYYLYYKPANVYDIEQTVIICMSRKWLLQTFFAKYGYQIKGDMFTDPHFENSHEMVPVTIENFLYPQRQVSNWFASIPVADLLPNISVSEWLASIKHAMCVSTTFSLTKKHIYFNLIDNILASNAVEDLTPYFVRLVEKSMVPNKYKGVKLGWATASEDQQIEDLAVSLKNINLLGTKEKKSDLGAETATAELGHAWYIQAENKIYVWGVYTVDPSEEVEGDEYDVYGWRLFAENLDDFTDAEEQLEIRSTYQPMVDRLALFSGQFANIPYVDVIGKSTPHQLTDADFTPRIGVWRGIKQGNLGRNYPMSSNNPYTVDDEHIEDGKALSPTLSDYALDKTYYKRFLQWIKKPDGKVFEAIMNMSSTKIESLPHNKVYRLLGVNLVILNIKLDSADGEGAFSIIKFAKV